MIHHLWILNRMLGLPSELCAMILLYDVSNVYDFCDYLNFFPMQANRFLEYEDMTLNIDEFSWSRDPMADFDSVYDLIYLACQHDQSKLLREVLTQMMTRGVMNERIIFKRYYLLSCIRYGSIRCTRVLLSWLSYDWVYIDQALDYARNYLRDRTKQRQYFRILGYFRQRRLSEIKKIEA